MPATGRSSPSRPTSPTATVRGVDRAVAERRGEGERDREVQAGLGDAHAAGEVRVHVVTAEADRRRGGRARRGAGRAASGRCPTRAARASSSRPGETSACTSMSSGRLPSSVAATTLPGAAPSWSARNARPGSATSRSPDSPISNTPSSSVEPKRFFVARTRRITPPRSPPRSMTASTRCSRVFGPGDRAVLGHVADEHDGDPLALRQLHEPERGLAHLPDAARRPVELVHGHRLDRVHDDEGRPARPRGLDDRPDLARRRTATASAAGPDPSPSRAGAQPDLARGFLAGRVEHAAGAAAATPPATWSSSVDFPTPGSPPIRSSDPGTMPPPRTRSSSARPVRRRSVGPSARCREGNRLGPPARRARAARVARAVRWRAVTTVSTRVFHAAHERHWPSQRGKSAPHAWQTNRLWARATAGTYETSTGVFCSAAWISNPPSGLPSTTIVVPRVPVEEQVLGEHVLDEVLDRPAQRPRAERRIPAELDEVVLRGLRDLERHALGLELLAHALEHELDDLADLVHGEAPEDHRRVDAVEELRPEAGLQLGRRPSPS